MTKIEQITKLIAQAGSDRKAAELIEQVRGVAPVHTALVRARQGKGTDYILQCYIDDLTLAFKNGTNK